MLSDKEKIQHVRPLWAFTGAQWQVVRGAHAQERRTTYKENTIISTLSVLRFLPHAQDEEKEFSMLAQLFDTACMVSPTLRRFLIRTWFHYLSRSDKEVLMPFMNLGYASLDP